MSEYQTFYFPNGTLICFDRHKIVVSGFCHDGIVVRNELSAGEQARHFVITHAKVREILGRVDTVVDVNYASDTPDEAGVAAKKQAAVSAWSDASEEQRDEALKKEAWVLACQKYIPAGPWTETAIARKFNEIKSEALRRQKRLHQFGREEGSFPAKTWKPKRVSQFCNIYFEQLKPSAEVLLNQKRKGNKDRRILTAEEDRLLSLTCQKYRSTSQPSGSSIIKAVKRAFDNASKDRMARGLLPLKVPHRNTIYRRLGSFPKFDKVVGRDGLQEAIKEFSPTEHGVRALKPGELIELDFQHVDVFTLREKSDYWDLLTPDLQAKLEDQERKKSTRKKVQRLVVCAAIDVATRMVLGVGVAETANVRTVIEVLDMVTRSKAELSRLAGCVGTWHQAAGLGTIVVDTGNEFFNKEIQTVIVSMGGSYTYGRTGVPMDKPYIERFFGTLRTMFADELPGKTGYSPDCLIGYDKEGMAAFNADVFRHLLIRFLVDYYPLQEHKGLMGKRPIEQWKEAKKYGCVPLPTVRVRRAATGLKLERTLTKEGVRILGIPFGDQTQFPKKIWGQKEQIELRLDPTDLREVTAYFGGKTYFLENKRPDLAGHSVRTLMAAIKKMTSTRKADQEFYEYTLSKYADDFAEMIEAGIASQGLPSTELDESTLEWFENSFCMKLQIIKNPDEVVSADMETLLSGGSGAGIFTPEMIAEEKLSHEAGEVGASDTGKSSGSLAETAADDNDRPDAGTEGRPQLSSGDEDRNEGDVASGKKVGRRFAGAPKGKGSFK